MLACLAEERVPCLHPVWSICWDMNSLHFDSVLEGLRHTVQLSQCDCIAAGQPTNTEVEHIRYYSLRYSACRHDHLSMCKMVQSDGVQFCKSLGETQDQWDKKSLLEAAVCRVSNRDIINKSTPLGVHHEESGLPACPERTWFASATGKARGNSPQVCKSSNRDIWTSFP